MMSAGQPYSDAAREAWINAMHDGATDGNAMAAMHDREALGLDASVHAASYRAELLRELADSFRPGPVDVEAEDVALFAMETRARIRREVVEEVAAWLRQVSPFDPANAWAYNAPEHLAATLLREFEVPHGQ